MSAGRVLITTVPFGQLSERPLDALRAAGVEFVINPLGRRLKGEELADLAVGFDGLIAGTEPITRQMMDNAPSVRFISRVGVGLDNVDLLAARERGIAVSYTPEAPAPAVAELTIGLMIGALRSVHCADQEMRAGRWYRRFGRRLGEITVGVIGAGRIGGRVIANDLEPKDGFPHVRWVEKDELIATADLVSLHVPLTGATRHLFDAATLARMKPGAVLVNTARGGIVDEAALAEALRAGTLGGAAIDVFAEEPYAGELSAIPSCLLTCHMGSMSEDCRAKMEIEATENALTFLAGGRPAQLVPETEYRLRENLESVS